VGENKDPRFPLRAEPGTGVFYRYPYVVGGVSVLGVVSALELELELLEQVESVLPVTSVVQVVLLPDELLPDELLPDELLPDELELL
jgi:hypothetical protein